MKITMAELAKKCGYSKATISRALADDPRVKPETKAFIQATAKKYNYHPHRVASNLARGRTKTIGLLFPAAPRTIADPFFLEYLQGVSETFFDNGFSLLIPQVRQTGIKETITRLVKHERVDGIILTEPKLIDERIKLLQKSEVPFVFLGSTCSPEVSWVDGDNRGGARKAVLALGSLGHENIAIITGEAGLVSTKNRLDGYKEALTELGLDYHSRFVWAGDFTHQGGYQAVDANINLLQEGLVTGIFASNDLMAIGAMQRLREEGFKIPDDISVIGFDGIEIGKYLAPPLTTVQQPVYELGKEVARVLLEQIENNAKPIQITLPVAVVNETSTIGKAIGKVEVHDGA